MKITVKFVKLTALPRFPCPVPIEAAEVIDIDQIDDSRMAKTTRDTDSENPGAEKTPRGLCGGNLIVFVAVLL
jgi:hypothetical protein